MNLQTGSPSTSGLFGCDVALCFGQKLETVCFVNVSGLWQDKTHTQPRTSEQKRRGEVGPWGDTEICYFGFIIAIGIFVLGRYRLLMDTHRVRERTRE
jgi:hypothetical protein